MAEPDPAKHQPFDIEVEQAVLGMMLRNNVLIDVVAADLEGRHFSDPMHARIYEMIVYLQTEGDVSPVIVHAVMKTDAGLITIGGQNYLESLFEAAPRITSVRHYVAVLLELSMRRELLAIAQEIADEVHEQPVSEWTAQKIADRATEAMLQAGRAVSTAPSSAYDEALESLRECERIAKGTAVPMIKTGLQKVDDEFGGLRGGDFVVVLGKSGMGKSALMGSASLNTARAQVPTLVFTLEMRRRQWVERMVCDMDYDGAMAANQKPMWYSRVRNGRLSEDEFSRFYLAAGHLQGLPIEIVEADDLTVLQIQAKARAFKAKWGKKPDGTERIGLVVVDYIQIVETTDPKENRERQVAKIARGLKSLAKRLNWVVMAGSQMNESDAGRSKEEKRPQASDARESKAIMNEADVMFAPFRPAYFVENRKPMDGKAGDPAWLAWRAELSQVQHRFELLTLKNRHGRRIDFELHCEMGASAIRDRAPKSSDETEQDQAAHDLLEGV